MSNRDHGKPLEVKAKNETLSRKPLTIQELRKHPPEASNPAIPEPTSEGYAQVSKDTDKPFNLYYRVYGHGPMKIVWISGHGDGIENWYGMMRHFGIANGDKGIGKSEAPWTICSAKDLAQDVKDLLDHLEWTAEKSVHVVGHSMGGMMAMQLAVHYPTLPASLSLLSTTSHWRRDLSLWKATKSTVDILTTLSADGRLSKNKSQLFGDAWLNAPDPTGRFPTNGDAWAAHTLHTPLPVRGAMLQAPAAVGHQVEPAQLRAIAQRLGPGRVGIVQGSVDQMIPAATAERMVDEFGGADNGAGVRLLLLDGVGHMPQVEREADVVAFIESIVLGGGGDEASSSGGARADADTDVDAEGDHRA